MKKELDLLKLIEVEKINLDENLHIPNILGIYINDFRINPTIGIKSNLSSTKEYCSVLAEELGHHFKTNGNLIINIDSYAQEISKEKEENMAKLWAANFLISDDELIEALINCISNKYDICEYFNASDELLRYKLYSILEDENKFTSLKSKLKSHEVAYSACEI